MAQTYAEEPIKYELANGDTKSFPALNDYVQQLIRDEQIINEDALLDDYPELIADIQRDWLSIGQNGCIFAAKLARDNQVRSWYDEVVLQPFNEPVLAQLNDTINCLAPDAEAIQVILPTVNSPKGVCTFVNHLTKFPEWSLSHVGREIDDQPEVTPFGLRWHLPSGEYVSWVLGFAPFDSMPFTRRAPFVSIIWRTQGPGRCPSLAGLGDRRPLDETCGVQSVHLADLPDGFSEEEKVVKCWEETEEKKAALLAHDDLVAFARARITFSLPSDAVNQLFGQ